MVKVSLQNLGLLILRIGIGIIFMIHGTQKLLGGAKALERVGSAMSLFGITFAPVLWGIAAALTMLLGGLALALGTTTRIASLLLAWTMVVALALHVSRGDPFMIYSSALSMLIVFIALACTGPGSYTLEKYLPFS